MRIPERSFLRATKRACGLCKGVPEAWEAFLRKYGSASCKTAVRAMWRSVRESSRTCVIAGEGSDLDDGTWGLPCHCQAACHTSVCSTSASISTKSHVVAYFSHHSFNPPKYHYQSGSNWVGSGSPKQTSSASVRCHIGASFAMRLDANRGEVPPVQRGPSNSSTASRASWRARCGELLSGLFC